MKSKLSFFPHPVFPQQQREPSLGESYQRYKQGDDEDRQEYVPQACFGEEAAHHKVEEIEVEAKDENRSFGYINNRGGVK